ncbi:aprataxin and PNK-like factor [Rhinophrynus dorsalis]
MSGFQLKATDGSGCTPLPMGETIIGRGPFLGIADKRVSRSHALLEVGDGILRIKPVHVNPCFYQASDKKVFLPLERNEWHILHPGDTFSLLPDKYTFRVITEYSSEEKPERNNKVFDKVGALNKDITHTPKASETKEEEPSCSIGNTSNRAQLHQSAKAHAEEGNASQSGPRKRILPDWMLQGNLDVPSLSSPVIKAGKTKRIGRARNTNIGKTEENTSSGKNLLSKDIMETQDESCLKKKKKTSRLESEVVPGTNGNEKTNVIDDDLEMQNNEHLGEVLLHSEINWDKGCDNGQKNSPPESHSNKYCRPSSSKATHEDDISLSPEEEEEDKSASFENAGSPQSADHSQKKRIPCMYGEGCYRKNPAHFEEFSHPGDRDYRDTETGSHAESDDRPECPYGTDCYRKNPQHKLEYKHTQPPAKGGKRLRKRAPKKGKGALDDDDDGEPNEYDLEDSFIDDDEEDFDNTDEDSDWMPDSEEKDSEDLKVLLKEAKTFVKGKH